METDITSLLRETASQIADGYFTTHPAFNFEASMRAVDIMDERVDSGLGMQDVLTVKERIEQNLVNFSPDDSTLVTLAECMLSSFFSWINGESFIRCYLSTIYFHEDSKKSLYKYCFEEKKGDSHSFVLLSFVDCYLSVYRFVRFIAQGRSCIDSDEFDYHVQDENLEITLSAEEKEKINKITTQYLSTCTNPALKAHFLLITSLRQVLRCCFNESSHSFPSDKESVKKIRDYTQVFLKHVKEIKLLYTNNTPITETPFFQDILTRFSKYSIPTKKPAFQSIQSICKSLESQTPVLIDYLLFLNSKFELTDYLREFSFLQFYPIYPIYRCILDVALHALFPTPESMCLLYIKSIHCSNQCLQSKGFKSIKEFVPRLLNSFLTGCLKSAPSFHRFIDNYINMWSQLSNMANEIRSTKDITEDDMHKISYYPSLMVMYLCFTSCHLELRLGIISSTELHVLLWYIDVVLGKVKESQDHFAILPSVDKKGNHKKFTICNFISSYHFFLSCYLRGLLFIIEGCHRGGLIACKEPVFSTIDQLFLQRSNAIAGTGLFPPATMNDYNSVFMNEEYTPVTLITNGLEYLDKAQEFISRMKKDNGVSELVWNDCCSLCQRCTLMNILAGRKIKDALQKHGNIKIQKQISFTLLPTLKILHIYFKLFVEEFTNHSFAGMKASLLSKCGKARCLSFNNIQTPAVMIQTKSCFQPYLTLDMLEKLPEKPMFSISTGDLYHFAKIVKQSQKGLKSFTALNDYYLHIQMRDIDNFPVPKASDTSVGILTAEGNRDLSMDEYKDIIDYCDVDSFVTFSDEVPLSVGKRRGRQSTSRSKNWLQDHLSTSTKKNGMIANIQVTENIQLLEEQIAIVNAHANELLGVHISGLHLGESPKQREFLLSTIYSKIPEDLVRFVTGPNTPSDILESIRCGTDVMVCSFPVLLAEKAYASYYYNGMICKESKCSKVNLFNTKYKDDTSAIVDGCDCYACSHFTKGYIHHLFNCHELLGTILLTHHNIHHFQIFLQAIRLNIQNNQLDDFASLFNQSFSWCVC